MLKNFIEGDTAITAEDINRLLYADKVAKRTLLQEPKDFAIEGELYRICADRGKWVIGVIRSGETKVTVTLFPYDSHTFIEVVLRLAECSTPIRHIRLEVDGEGYPRLSINGDETTPAKWSNLPSVLKGGSRWLEGEHFNQTARCIYLQKLINGINANIQRWVK